VLLKYSLVPGSDADRAPQLKRISVLRLLRCYELVMKKQFWLLILGPVFCVSSTVHIVAQETLKPKVTSKPPLELGLLVDNSGSVRSNFSNVIEVSKGVVENSQSEDEIFLVRFISADMIQIVNDFTTEKSILTRALDEMYVEGGLSAITDALYVSAEHLAMKGEKAGSEAHKRALILITDGAEENSNYRMERLLSLLREKNIRVYAVGFLQALIRQGLKVQERAKTYLTRLAEESGGRVYFPETSNDVKAVANTIFSDIRSSN
jgi:Ca-activated chloride channel family protein